MTMAEFKAWFAGYTEGIHGAPTAEQLARIKEQVEKISADGGSRTTYVYPDTHTYPSQWMPVQQPWVSGTGTLPSRLYGNIQ